MRNVEVMKCVLWIIKYVKRWQRVRTVWDGSRTDVITKRWYLNWILKAKWNLDTQEQEKSYPDGKNSRSRKAGLRHVYLDDLRTKLALQEGFLGVATVGKFGQIRLGPVYKGSRTSSWDVRMCEIGLYGQRNKKLKTILGRLPGYVCSIDIGRPAISLFSPLLEKDSLIHRISSKSLRTFRNVLETFRNRALKLVRLGMKDKEPKMTPSLAVQGDWRMPVAGRR